MYLFDPVQLKEYGHNFYQGDGFTYRYQKQNKIFWTNIYIPFGPSCQTKQGFLNFLSHIKDLKRSRVTIDLPMIYCKETKEEVLSFLKDYKSIPYKFQDEETIVFSSLNPDKQLRYEIRQGEKNCQIVVKNSLTEKELSDLYNIYLYSSKRIGFKAKDISVFKKMNQSCLVALSYMGDEMVGFVFGYIQNYCTKGFSKKDFSKILLNMFTGELEKGRIERVGQAMHYHLFSKAFAEYGVDLVDLRGASRTKDRAYLAFKKKFSSDFYPLPGSFQNFS